jgi:uncharacterized protein YjiS (DUF1127 family)
MISQAPQSGSREEETLLAANDIAAVPISVDGGLWQRSLHVQRISSAGREVERSWDMIVLWRRWLAEPKEHLTLVPSPRSMPTTQLGRGATSAPGLRVLIRRLHAAFITARQIIAQWRRRARIRNELTTLSDGDLRDIRWTRAEVEAECRKPFWRA